MHVVADLSAQVVRHKVIFNSRVRLHNVAALAANVHVVDIGVFSHIFAVDFCWPWFDGKDVRAVLESASVLVGVHGKREEGLGRIRSDANCTQQVVSSMSATDTVVPRKAF